MYKVSIVIPTYGRPDSLRQAVESVLVQSYTNIEVIVVDDNGIGSEQSLKTETLMFELLKQDSRLKYVQLEKNLGGSLARNKGIEVSSGEFVTFLDDDDEYYKNKIEKQIEFYSESFPDKNGFINCKMDVYLQGKFLRVVETNIDNDNILFSAVSEKILGTPSLFIPKKLLYSVGLFTDRVKGQEWDLIVKLVSLGCPFIHLNESLVRVNVSNNSITSNKSLKQNLKGINDIYHKQEEYFKFFTLKQKKQIKHSHYYKLAVAYINNDKSTSIKFFFMSLANKIFSILNLKYLVKLFLFVISKDK